MVFNSFEFLIFFVCLYAIYIFSNHSWQNKILLAGSYFFYGMWDWRFLSLILFSSCLDYYCGNKIYASEETKTKKFFLYLSVASNLTLLGFFKYYNFFVSNLVSLLESVSLPIGLGTLEIILPVGISFYTFQTMSYTIDIYREKLKPAEDFLDFALFVSFFPQLVAGPIERAKNLLPQVIAPRIITLEAFYKGSFIFFWGLFQKIVIADNLAMIVDPVFQSHDTSNGGIALIAIYAFAFQIFCDFAGYSNMARGLSKCLGFDIMINFNLPYFAKNPKEFWQKWHISLSSWLRDYLYISLGGNRGSSLLTYRNLLLTMILGGLWHGAAWTFILWGIYQGSLLVIHRLLPENSVPLENVILQKTISFFKIACFFQLVCIGWLIFRAKSLEQIYNFMYAIAFNLNITEVSIVVLLKFCFFTSIILSVQILQFVKQDLLAIYHLPYRYKAFLYIVGFYLFVLLGAESGKEFIYFQF